MREQIHTWAPVPYTSGTSECYATQDSYATTDNLKFIRTNVNSWVYFKPTVRLDYQCI